MQRSAPALDVEAAVRERYSAAAGRIESELCCPVEYDTRYLQAIPEEVLERDYGCGDPSRHVQAGDTVLDLGSGGGKICFIASQIAGPAGRVIGIDMNDEMLALARGAAPEVARRVGFGNVEFRRARIQDLRLDLDRLDGWLAGHPVASSAGLPALDAEMERLRSESPLVPDGSVDLVLSNCVLNLVRLADRQALVSEIFRVLRPGGRIALSDIVSDEPVPAELQADPALWSGCVSGAFQERELLEALEQSGFYGIEVAQWSATPFRVVAGIEFRSVTVTARKGKEGPCYEGLQAVVYRGPWKQVEDDDHHVLRRGERTAVCEKTFRILTGEPYASEIIPVPPLNAIPDEPKVPYDCARTAPRHPRETKGEAFNLTTEDPGAACTPGACC